MKKFLLILLLSLGLIGSANSESNIQLPSKQAVRDYLHSNLPSPRSLELELAVIQTEAIIEMLAEQYLITIDEEEKTNIDMLIIEQREHIELLNGLLSRGYTGYVSLFPRDYGLFKNHLIFSVTTSSIGLEWNVLPSMDTGGYFYTDGKSINYLYGGSRERSLERLFKNEKLQFETVDTQALANFVSDILFQRGNSGASVIRDMSDIVRTGVIRRNEDSINEDCPFNLSDYKKVEFELLSSEEQEFLRVNALASYGFVNDYHECFGFTDQELTTLTHDELIEIAKKRGFDSLLSIVLPSLKKEGDNWILEFTTTYGWMHERQLLRLHNITFSPEYKVSLKEIVLSRDLYMGIPELVY